MFAGILGGFDVAVEADFEFGVARSDDGEDEDAILPNDWGGVGEAGDVGFPAEVFAGFDVPGGGKRF